MISYIVAVNDGNTFEMNLNISWSKVDAGDELITVSHQDSIAKAYNLGIKQSTQPIKCFIHQDVIILDPPKLYECLRRYCTHDVGMVGVIGTVDGYAVPWWNGNEHIGSVVDPTFGLYIFGTDGGECAFLDGLLLATVQDIQFDESYPGFHFYDQDICKSMLSRGLPNYCLPMGHRLVVHNAKSKPDSLEPYIQQYNQKWNLK
jgi:hypothetical protein